MEKKQSRILLIITGLITAGVILFSQLFYVQNASLSKKEVKTEQTEDQAPTEDLVISAAPSISIPISSTIEVEKEQSFIFEILFEQEIDFPAKDEVSRTLGKFFQHLFRVIISPNAP